ncbi:poly(3-hydroxybutyrate) depolymerase [Halomonas sp. MCCC 1A17488]|uniref:Poly(3-hydroxybutyrate) depolymerase n=1 Tax=Billgrantia sulfidoxydans TaxID=2733484 RepID=A0ABX7W958_9GAMM|nr:MULTISPECIES: poly(3-hydroxybutyrate) depolymerase [Halomonas]MCE8017417.1 poly(3-hydroxybutyrate) depolymerase [Halomonas sp. MCCC 1A17488]MCG3240750.1 poly(3-hydroxybutyrate) depolymerase [Halomonas sp. MCCC 1A17488]QPP49412.1 poly(3-hydroxybutyrate) depolymerase [Halomonas sp. SS10-MC5]QTP56770.1 poly(3-hydroxybutyrate) depolymerase [Halomonas sulfidoxydans]
MRVAPLIAAGLLLASAANAEERLPELPRLAVVPDDTSVIGVSSGGYMATQLAIAWPERFRGLAVLAAGPWSCAEGGLGQALGQCMSLRRGRPDLNALDVRRRDYQARDLVGEADDIAELRAFVWHGEADGVVDPSLGGALAEQLAGWLNDPEEQLKVVQSPDVGHGWPIEADERIPPSWLAPCGSGGGSHMLACGLDIAGEALAWLHGSLEPAQPISPARLLRFDQAPFDARGLGDVGYVLVPEECEAGGCGLTVALHGCGMTEEQIDEAFVRYSGLNEWAAANRRVVLYPQASPSLANPQGCWDWWGFAESTWQLDPLHDTREGTQVKALMAMVERLEEASEE